jgi:hypothetical protein
MRDQKPKSLHAWESAMKGCESIGRTSVGIEDEWGNQPERPL